jgi:hypothetical protein
VEQYKKDHPINRHILVRRYGCSNGRYYDCGEKPNKNFVNFIKGSQMIDIEPGIFVEKYNRVFPAKLFDSENAKCLKDSLVRNRDDVMVDVGLELRDRSRIPDINATIKSINHRRTNVSMKDFENFVATYDIVMQPGITLSEMANSDLAANDNMPANSDMAANDNMTVNADMAENAANTQKISTQKLPVQFEYFVHPPLAFVKYDGRIGVDREVVTFDAGPETTISVTGNPDEREHGVWLDGVSYGKGMGFRYGKPIMTPFVYCLACMKFFGKGVFVVNTGFPEFRNVTFTVKTEETYFTSSLLRNIRVEGSDENNILMQIAEKCNKELFAKLLCSAIADEQPDMRIDNIIDMDYIDAQLLKHRERILAASASQSGARAAAKRPFCEMLDSIPFTDRSAKPIEPLSSMSDVSPPTLQSDSTNVASARLQSTHTLTVQPEILQPETVRSDIMNDVKESRQSTYVSDPREEFANDILDNIPTSGIVNQTQLFKFLNSLAVRFGSVAALKIISRKGSHVQIAVNDTKSTLVVPHGGKPIRRSGLKEFIMRFM